MAGLDHPSDQELTEYSVGRLPVPASDTLQHHLSTCETCRIKLAGISQSGTAVIPGAKSQSGRTIPNELLSLTQYADLRELARGGMGVVYFARNLLMDRDEVLKTVQREMLERDGATERFLQEIRSAARLRHPNVVGAYDAKQIGDLLILSMEFVPGEDLAKVTKRLGTVPVQKAAYYAHQVALGLQHAFEKGMVHRDIKPSNLILTKEGTRAVVKILDFGLAKATSEKKQDRELTVQGMMLGTPDFVAPEQILDAASATIRADIYSLGCTLYFMLSGQVPFRSSHLFGLLRHHAETTATPLNELRPEVPVGLANVVAKMMAKHPDDRYQTPNDVARALIPFIKGTAPDTMAAAPEIVMSTLVLEPGGMVEPPPVPTSRTILEPMIPPVPKLSDSRASKSSSSSRVPAVPKRDREDSRDGRERKQAEPARRPQKQGSSPIKPILIALAVLIGGAGLVGIFIAALSEGDDPKKGASAKESKEIDADWSEVMAAKAKNKALAFYKERGPQRVAIWKREAEQKNPKAMILYARCLLEGLGVAKDIPGSVEWYRKAAELGEPIAMNNLGFAYNRGEGVPQDHAEAVKWYRKGAELGESMAMNNLGYSYAHGEGITKDPVEAVKWYRKSAELGEAIGMRNYGNSLTNGEGVAKDDVEAVKWYRKAAELDDLSAIRNLGIAYMNGEGVTKDETEGCRWLRKGAEAGDESSMNNLGINYLMGKGVAEDKAKALEWFRKAADLKDQNGTFNVGVCYESGYGVSKSPTEALSWYRKSADLGFPRGMWVVGTYYENGIGVTKDTVEANRWFQKARENGFSPPPK